MLPILTSRDLSLLVHGRVYNACVQSPVVFEQEYLLNYVAVCYSKKLFYVMLESEVKGSNSFVWINLFPNFSAL